MTQDEFKKIFDEYFDAIRNYIYYRSGDVEMATDVAQEVFMKVWEKQFDTSKGIKSLLYKMASDAFVSHYRKNSLAMDFANQYEFSAEEITPEDEYNFNQLKQKYKQALKEMPEKPKVVYLMKRVEELKNNEIAIRLSITIKAVEKRMTQALNFLRKFLNYER